MMHDPDDLSARLWTASEQIRLTATALACIAEGLDAVDEAMVPHIARLEHRAAELMRTTLRLARDAGLAESWGLELLFSGSEPSRPRRPQPAASQSIELDPLPLFDPLPPPPVRRLQPVRAPWTAQPTLPGASEPGLPVEVELPM